MVRKRAKNGGYYHEAPYTWEEEMDLYRRVAGNDVKLTVLHAPAKKQAPPKSEPEK